MQVRDFYIVIDRPFSVFEPGDLVSGKVVIKLTERLLCDQIAVQFQGSARVSWMETEKELMPQGLVGVNMVPYAVKLRQVPYSQERIYFDERKDLWKKATTADAILKQSVSGLNGGLRLNIAHSRIADASRAALEPGEHKFAFQFQLPDELPTSFDSNEASGSIRYTVEALIRDWGETKFKRKSAFYVTRKQDLNRQPELALSTAQQQQIPFRPSRRFLALSSSKSSGQLHLCLTAAKTGYVPGEPLMVKLECTNSSAKAIKYAQVQLVQHVTCYAVAQDPNIRVGTKHVKKTLVSQCCTGKWTRKTGKMVFEPIIYVPAVTPTFAEVDLIEVFYTVVASVATSKRDRIPVLQATIPITIGTVPMLGDALLPTYESIIGCPPPSYEESFAGSSGTGNYSDSPSGSTDDEDPLPQYHEVQSTDSVQQTASRC